MFGTREEKNCVYFNPMHNSYSNTLASYSNTLASYSYIHCYWLLSMHMHYSLSKIGITKSLAVLFFFQQNYWTQPITSSQLCKCEMFTPLVEGAGRYAARALHGLSLGLYYAGFFPLWGSRHGRQSKGYTG